MYLSIPPASAHSVSFSHESSSQLPSCNQVNKNHRQHQAACHFTIHPICFLAFCFFNLIINVPVHIPVFCPVLMVLSKTNLFLCKLRQELLMQCCASIVYLSGRQATFYKGQHQSYTSRPLALMQYRPIPYNSKHLHAIPYNTIQYQNIPNNTMQ